MGWRKWPRLARARVAVAIHVEVPTRGVCPATRLQHRRPETTTVGDSRVLHRAEEVRLEEARLEEVRLEVALPAAVVTVTEVVRLGATEVALVVDRLAAAEAALAVGRLVDHGESEDKEGLPTL